MGKSEALTAKALVAMKKYLVSFATTEFLASQKKLIKTAKKFGIDDAFSYTKKKIRKTEFYVKNRQILDCVRGAGYWLWKPYCILDAMSHINEGDLILYLDAGVEVMDDLSPLFDLCVRQKGILLFRAHGRLNRVWIKRDCFVLMNCDLEKYWNAEHITASYELYIKSDESIKFLQEWLHYGCNPNIITDSPNIRGLPNFPDFKEHRHDQAILSLLAAKHGIRRFRNPSQWGDPYKAENTDLNLPYKTIFNHHRTRAKPSLLGRIRNFLTGQ
jgi:hypothetical protein